jgi:purine-nucleoside phosphorylase
MQRSPTPERFANFGCPMHKKIQNTVDAIAERCKKRAKIGLILGSGLSSFVDSLEYKCLIPYADLPYFPKSTTAGHAGNFVLGELAGIFLAVLQGRIHFYEGYTPAEVVYPVRVLWGLGVRQLIVTNAAGAVNTGLRPGDLMLITDHINLMGRNPLVGRNVEELGPRFPDMSEAYSVAMRQITLEAAALESIGLQQGVYLGLSGPSYETPAEIRMCRTLGADAVGMSTVPEVIAAKHMGMQVLGISCITNMAAGVRSQNLSHQEVLETSARAKEQLVKLLRRVVQRLDTLKN